MGTKILVLIAGVLVSQMAFAASDCSLAVDDIHTSAADAMVLKGYVVVDKSEAIKAAVPQLQKDGDILALVKAMLDEGQYTVLGDGSSNTLLQKVKGNISIIKQVDYSNLENAIKFLPDCKDL